MRFVARFPIEFIGSVTSFPASSRRMAALFAPAALNLSGL
jgi:hypothetical protein